MARISAAMLLASAILAPACAPPVQPVCPPAPPSTKAEGPASTVATPKPTPPSEAADDTSTFKLAITIRPVAEPPGLEVEINARGPASDLDVWSIAAPEPGAVRAISARDLDGAIAVSTSPDAGSAAAPATPSPSPAPAPAPATRAPLRIKLAHPPLGPLRITYTLAAAPFSLSTRPAVEISPDGFRALAEAFLALPEAAADAPISASIKIDAADLPVSNVAAASSFGIGASRDVKTRARDLREAAFFAGRIGHAVFDAPEGHDEAGWLGYTTFDPRPIAADVASFRTAVRQVFREPTSPSATFFILPDARARGAFVASRRAGGVILHIGVGEPWSAPVRIAVAAEVLKAWIGERLWVGPAEPGREPEAYWFTEGVTRHLARDLLFRFGLISPSEVLDEVHGLAGTIATSPRKSEPNSALAARASEPSVVPLLVARGALYATRADALLRAKSGGKASLEDVLRALYTKASEQRAPLPTSAWVDAIAKELGPSESAVFETAIVKGGELKLPDDALGPCFRGAPHRYEAFDLGFTEQSTSPSDPRRIVTVRSGGPAEKAGLRTGDVLTEAQITPGRSDVPVSLTIERGPDKKTIKYRPAGPAANGPGWTRKKDVPDEACVR